MRLRALLISTLFLTLGTACHVRTAETLPAPASPSNPPGLPDAEPSTRPFYLIADYLPLAQWEGEPFTLCLRAENTLPAAANAILTVRILDGAGKDVSVEHQMFSFHGAIPEKTKAEPAGTSAPVPTSRPSEMLPYQRDLTLTPEAQEIRCELRAEGRSNDEPLSELRILLVRNGKPWPRSAFKAGAWEEVASGARIALLVKRRLKQIRREFAPLAWAIGDKKTGAEKEAPPWVFTPGLWHVFPNTADEKPRTHFALGPWPASGVPPLLPAIDEILKQLSYATPVPARVRILLPPEDLERGTAPRLAQTLLQGLLERLSSIGVHQKELIAPFRQGIPSPIQDAYAQAVNEAAEGFAPDARTLDFSAGRAERYWQATPEIVDVLLSVPNKEGLDWLREKLKE